MFPNNCATTQANLKLNTAESVWLLTCPCYKVMYSMKEVLLLDTTYAYYTNTVS